MEGPGQVLHVRQGIMVRGGDEIQATVVATGSPGAVGFFNHVQGRGPRT